MDLDELIKAHGNITERCANMRADLAVHGLLFDALLLALPPEGRAVVEANFKVQSEQYLANGLMYSKDPTGRALERVEEAIQRQAVRLAAIRGD